MYSNKKIPQNVSYDCEERTEEQGEESRDLDQTKE